MRKIEILAPAGSYEGMRAAMNAGCDAVYIGGSSFGARAFADNPDDDTLLRAIDEAHIRDKKLYLTVNTLLKEKELTGKLYAFLEKFYRQGLDAVIVQDVGVMHFIHRTLPELPIHASTQMTLTMAQGAEVLKNNGVTRMVTSRELSFQEIKTIRENTMLEIETFVHGALCYSYSGQCLMSSLIGGRSGNRGRCAQPCRMPYKFYLEGRREGSESEKYLLSPKDINTIENIPELIEAGVDSFKIEGRMKRPEYAAAVASMYRKYVDIYMELGGEAYRKLLNGDEYERDMLLLLDVYNRGGFSAGYGESYHGKNMMSLNRPNHSGVFVGEVAKVNGSRVSIQLSEELHAQDILEIRSTNEEGYEFTVKDPHGKGEILETNIGIRRDTVGKPGIQVPVIKAGMKVYRTKNNELLESLAKEYQADNRQIRIRGVLTARIGEKLSLNISFKDFTVTAYQDIVQEAVRQPMSTDKLVAPIYKTGDTLYYFEDLQVIADENIFVPVAWLNEIRREGIRELQEQVALYYRRGLDNKDGRDRKAQSDFEVPMYQEPVIDQKETEFSKSERHTGVAQLQECTRSGSRSSYGIIVAVQKREQYEIALQFPEITELIADYEGMEIKELTLMAKQAGSFGKGFYLALPHICRLSTYQRLEKELYEIIDNNLPTGFLVKNFEEVSLVQSLSRQKGIEIEIILNHNMYVFNREAKDLWHEKEISRYTAPVELNLNELKLLGMEDLDVLVYGYLPLMVSAQCLLDNTTGCKKCGQNRSGLLTDRMNKKFFVQTRCSDCYNIIYNGQPLALHKLMDEIIGMMPRNIRLDFTVETPSQIKQIIEEFLDHIQNKKKASEIIKEYTTGHVRRGVD